MSSVLTNAAARRNSIAVDVAGVFVGGGHPVVVQSMTNTDTADVEATVRQVKALATAGSELVRITVDRNEAAAAVPHIKEKLLNDGVHVPLVGDFHYIGHKLLAEYPACAEALDKYRINPGNVGFKEKKDRQFSAIIEHAIKWNKPVRIGVNWGSLDSELLTFLMDENAKATQPNDARSVMHEAIVQSALRSSEQALNVGLPADRIIISAKVSAVQDLIAVYTMLAKRCRYALHVGLTEAGMGSKGIVSSSAAMGILLQQGIGDTIRFSLTPEPGGDRTLEVRAAQELLQTMGIRSFVPAVTACPGCGRTTSTVFQELAQDVQNIVRDRMPEWKTKYPGVENLNLAVMGCIVNGPGESKHADIGISLPGTGEEPAAPVFIDGKKSVILRGPNIADEFKQIVEQYVEERFSVDKVETSEAVLPDAIRQRLQDGQQDRNEPASADDSVAPSAEGENESGVIVLPAPASETVAVLRDVERAAASVTTPAAHTMEQYIASENSGTSEQGDLSDVSPPPVPDASREASPSEAGPDQAAAPDVQGETAPAKDVGEINVESVQASNNREVDSQDAPPVPPDLPPSAASHVSPVEESAAAKDAPDADEVASTEEPSDTAAKHPADANGNEITERETVASAGGKTS